MLLTTPKIERLNYQLVRVISALRNIFGLMILMSIQSLLGKNLNSLRYYSRLLVTFTFKKTKNFFYTIFAYNGLLISHISC